MRYVTKSTLNARLASAPNVVIFIPPMEVVETEVENTGVVVRVKWRGQFLDANAADLDPKTSLSNVS